MPVNQPLNQISFHFLKPFGLKNRTRLKAFLATTLKKEGYRIEALTYVLCSDQYLLELNQAHLKHDYFTDILSFDLSTSAKSLLGEVYISVDRVRDNAKRYQRSVTEEMHRVIFHGALHLAGYKDNTNSSQRSMRAAEDRLLRQYFAV
jgi:rRNA maturation RNase YbeY